MPDFKCYSQNNPNVVWDYCPSYTAAVLWIVLFGLTTAAHIFQAIWYRKSFAWVLIMGGLWECGGYIARIFSVQHQLSSGIYVCQFLLILLAPLWINAFLYMILGRLVHLFLESDRVFSIKARRITLIFVLFDITAFTVQCAGGSMMSGQPGKQILHIGLGVYDGGIGLQLLAIFIFIAISIRFSQLMKHRQCYQEHALEDHAEDKSQQPLYFTAQWDKAGARQLYALWTALGLIIVRNIYRLLEYSLGFNGTIVHHEWFAYVFDAVPMLTAMVVLNLFHPGKVLQGLRSGFSEENKALKAVRQDKKKRQKEDRTRRKVEKALRKGNSRLCSDADNEE